MTIETDRWRVQTLTFHSGLSEGMQQLDRMFIFRIACPTRSFNARKQRADCDCFNKDQLALKEKSGVTKLLHTASKV